MASTSIMSISLYLNGVPRILLQKEPYNFKQVLELNELAASFPVPFNIRSKHSTLNDESSTIAYYENLLYKKGSTSQPTGSCLLILLISQYHHFNPFIIDDLFISPVTEVLR